MESLPLPHSKEAQRAKSKWGLVGFHRVPHKGCQIDAAAKAPPPKRRSMGKAGINAAFSSSSATLRSKRICVTVSQRNRPGQGLGTNLALGVVSGLTSGRLEQTSEQFKVKDCPAGPGSTSGWRALRGSGLEGEAV